MSIKDASLDTMIPPWLGVATISMPGIRVSDQSILPQGEKSGFIASAPFDFVCPKLGHISEVVILPLPFYIFSV